LREVLSDEVRHPGRFHTLLSSLLT
jgi:hypothetical protein